MPAARAAGISRFGGSPRRGSDRFRWMNLSEQAVFRWVVIVGVAAVSVIVLTLLTRSLIGALWGLVLVCAGAWHGYRWLERKRSQR